LFFSVGWLVPVIPAVAPIFAGVYENIGDICYLNTKPGASAAGLL
jgi:hypothetical protein